MRGSAGHQKFFYNWTSISARPLEPLSNSGMDNIERGAVAHGAKKNPFVKQGLVPRRVVNDRVQSIRAARRNRDAAQAKTAAISRNAGRLHIIVVIRENVYRTRCVDEHAIVYLDLIQGLVSLSFDLAPTHLFVVNLLKHNMNCLKT